MPVRVNSVRYIHLLYYMNHISNKLPTSTHWEWVVGSLVQQRVDQPIEWDRARRCIFDSSFWNSRPTILIPVTNLWQPALPMHMYVVIRVCDLETTGMHAYVTWIARRFPCPIGAWTMSVYSKCYNDFHKITTRILMTYIGSTLQSELRLNMFLPRD